MPKVKRMGTFNIEFTVRRGELEYLRTDCGNSDEANKFARRDLIEKRRGALTAYAKI